ncbi:DUF885 domain-containing protein [Crateriforma conspicua]|uniref:DUF885 domain-containing protein n=1 Tax=Crateriforma conspicua TaxID=2527996 RepID=A0A5C5YEQ6_9PLAN|nr:DUF885 domain-containing protein [Crateriforma conspicua]TWT71722.1 hypothetical protein Pan14r_40380 [Crateriforma conspicua]
MKLRRNVTSVIAAFLIAICTLSPVLCGQTVAPDSSDSPAPSTAGPTDPTLRRLMDDVWEFELDESPMLATDVGDPRGQDRLADDSIQAIERRFEKRAEFLDRLDEIDPQSLNRQDAIDHDLLHRRLSRQQDDHRFQTYLMPINNREGFHISFPELARTMNLKAAQDFENYIARLNDFGRYTDQQITLLKAGMDAGLTQPAIIMRDSVSQAEAHVVDDAEQSLFLTNITPESIDRLDPERWQTLRLQIIQAIESTVVPAYRRFATFLRDQYVPACRGSVAAYALPDGREFYASQILKFTTLPMTATELHQTGIRENARIRKEMDAIRVNVGFDGDLPEFLTHLRTAPEFYAETPEQLMKEVAYVLKRADGRLPEIFGRLPRIPYGIREIPAFVAPQTTSAYYWPPATDGSRGGFYYVNTYNLPARPLYQLEALSLHEAVPGHHLQLALQAELDGLHPIRKQSGFTAFIEGWALYSERLGKEIGFYEDPYQDFGRLSMEAWRASRLVVDTGIHALGWSRQRAIEYMKANTALSEHNVVAEVDRYIGWPGQALAYKVGQLYITDLRQQAEEALGDSFDVREFHDVVLGAGSIPLPVLGQRVKDYIDRADVQ